MKLAAALLLASSVSAIKIQGGPDVYGPNGANYLNENPNFDLSLIGISRTTQGKGPQCTVGDWAIVQWKGYLGDGRLVTDSRAEGMGFGKTFSVGKSEVFKCWDLALPQLKKGDVATISCPSQFVWGGAYTISPLGGEPVPLWSDVTFDLEVQDCARNPESFAQPNLAQPHTTTLQPGKCFYLRSKTAADTGNLDNVLTSQDGQLTVEHKVLEDPNQQFYVSPVDGSIYNVANSQKVLDFSDKNKLTFAKPGASANQKGYDYTTEDQVTNPDGLVLTYDNQDKLVKFAGNLKENGQFWHVEYCYNFIPIQNLDQEDNDVDTSKI